MILTFCGLNATYTITIAKIIFEIIDVYIGNSVIYVIIAYILPIALEITTLIILVLSFNIIEVAYIIIEFIIKFSKNTISI